MLIFGKEKNLYLDLIALFCLSTVLWQLPQYLRPSLCCARKQPLHCGHSSRVGSTDPSLPILKSLRIFSFSFFLVCGTRFLETKFFFFLFFFLPPSSSSNKSRTAFSKTVPISWRPVSSRSSSIEAPAGTSTVRNFPDKVLTKTCIQKGETKRQNRHFGKVTILYHFLFLHLCFNEFH